MFNLKFDALDDFGANKFLLCPQNLENKTQVPSFDHCVFEMLQQKSS